MHLGERTAPSWHTSYRAEQGAMLCLDMHLLSIDEGITGYRDDSLRTVQSNALTYNLPLTILSYADLYQGWTMDAVV